MGFSFDGALNLSLVPALGGQHAMRHLLLFVYLFGLGATLVVEDFSGCYTIGEMSVKLSTSPLPYGHRGSKKLKTFKDAQVIYPKTNFLPRWKPIDQSSFIFTMNSVLVKHQYKIRKTEGGFEGERTISTDMLRSTTTSVNVKRVTCDEVPN